MGIFMQSGNTCLKGPSNYTIHHYLSEEERSRKNMIVFFKDFYGSFKSFTTKKNVLSCIVTSIMIYYVLTVHHVSQNVIQIFNTFFAGSFWATMISYCSLCLLKLYGIAKPLHYRNRFTIYRCLQIILFSWIIFVVFIAITMLFTP
uniref:Uncharacterized protein n=1 Tax=Ditylenchus dipsaci TaxID=166011 RepID=A0A915ETC5_9BILA